MDLAYPTIKQTNTVNQFNELDKLARSILLSTHDLPKLESIQQRIKRKIQRAIACDNARKLHKIIEQEVIRFNVQIGTAGSRLNLLHCCAKNNAYQCTEYILKSQYQYYRQQYVSFINLKTVEGYTALVVAVINKSHRVLQKLLECGGIDIYVQDQLKKTPYQMAIIYRNDQAVRLLMMYQNQTKKKLYINKQMLSLPLNFTPQTYWQIVTSCLLSSLSFGFYDYDDGFQQKQDFNFKVSDYIIEEDCIDYVNINSRKQLRGYDIQWKRASQIMSGKISVFQSYNPFEIHQSNFTIKNNLIVFQCLSQQPSVLMRIIKPDRCKNNQYNVFLYPNKLLHKQTIDDFIPYIKERREAMFLSNQQQMWPMLLQKALAKLHKSYFSLAQLDPKKLLEQITGFPTVQIKIRDISQNQVVSFLQKITTKNYLYLLRGKQNTDLCENKQSVQCFTILNYYQSNSKSLVLVNCPFINETWRKKQKQEDFVLTMIKGHYNTHKQMCVWIQSSKIKDYFDSVIVSLSFKEYQRSQLKIKTRKNVFFKFKIEQKRQQNVVFQLSNLNTQEAYNLTDLQLIKNQGKQIIQNTQIQLKKYTKNLFQLQCNPGEYMGFYQIDKVSLDVQPFLLLCWSPVLVQPQFVQPQLGVLQWLGFFKNHFIKSKQQCVLQTIDQFSLVLFREKTDSIVLLRFSVNPEDIIQGKLNQQSGFVEMVTEGKVHYCVLKKIIQDTEIVFDFINKQQH